MISLLFIINTFILYIKFLNFNLNQEIFDQNYKIYKIDYIYTYIQSNINLFIIT